MNDDQARHQGVILEDIQDQVKRLAESLADVPADLKILKEKFGNLVADMRIVKAAVTDTSKQQANHEQFITVIETV